MTRIVESQSYILVRRIFIPQCHVRCPPSDLRMTFDLELHCSIGPSSERIDSCYETTAASPVNLGEKTLFESEFE